MMSIIMIAIMVLMLLVLLVPIGNPRSVTIITMIALKTTTERGARLAIPAPTARLSVSAKVGFWPPRLNGAGVPVTLPDPSRLVFSG